MDYDKKNELAHSSWAPYILIGITFICAGAYGLSEVEIIRRYAAGVFGTSLGGALLLWGKAEIRDGRIKGKRVYVYRDNTPVMFFTLLAGKRIIPGGVMLLAGLWHAFSHETY